MLKSANLPAVFEISDEVSEALAAEEAVVALESSIIAQGFPAPDNFVLAGEMTEAVRTAGAVPAQIALFDGKIKIGLDAADHERLASGSVLKCSARDIAYVLTKQTVGATTVAATARIADLSGIRIFATGGVGGVHPGQGPLDVSADLLELSRSRVAVVCSGAKSILDLPATVEALEALGIPVLGYCCDDFPAFHAISSGLPLGQRCNDPVSIAKLLRTHWSLGMTAGGVVVCNPPPVTQAIDKAELDDLVSAALKDAKIQNIRGAEVTPFLLERLNQLSGGRTLAVNRALVLGNARLAALLAIAYASMN